MTLISGSCVVLGVGSLAPARAVAARLGLVAARAHRAPAAAPGGRAVVEARAARLRGADAQALALRGRPEQRGGVERDHAQGAAGRVGRRAPRPPPPPPRAGG